MQATSTETTEGLHGYYDPDLYEVSSPRGEAATEVVAIDKPVHFEERRSTWAF
jgi:hypothetical protein